MAVWGSHADSTAEGGRNKTGGWITISRAVGQSSECAGAIPPAALILYVLYCTAVARPPKVCSRPGAVASLGRADVSRARPTGVVRLPGSEVDPRRGSL